MTSYPDALRFKLLAGVGDGLAVCRTVLIETSAPPWPAITSWEIDDDEGTGTLLAALDTPAGRGGCRFDWKCGTAVSASVIPLDDRVDVVIYLYDVQRDLCTDWVVAVENLVERLLRRGLPISHALLERHGGGVADCIPRIQIIGGPSYLLVTHDEDLAEVFESPSRAIAVGEWEVKQVGAQRVLTRAIGRETSVEMLSAIQDGQWAMVRLAKPGAVQYGIGVAEEEEEAIFHEGERTVLAVGYDAKAHVATFSCATSPDEHIRGWEIYALKAMIEAGKLENGKRLRELRVVFADEASMQREKRPLLDIGAAVSYYDARGALVPYADPG